MLELKNTKLGVLFAQGLKSGKAMIKEYKNKIFIILPVIFLVLMYFANSWVNKAIRLKITENSNNIILREKEKLLRKDRKPSQTSIKDIVRIETPVPQKDYTQNIIYADKQEVARFKKSKNKIFSVVGKIPDGKIKFFNRGSRTYGYEYFRSGKYQGEYVEYYNTGEVYKEIIFGFGHVVSEKKYLPGKILMLEVKYAGPQYDFGDDTKREGKGKIYRPDGQVKIEWNRVSGESGYEKIYNAQGDMIEALYYDENDQLTEHWRLEEEQEIEP